MVTEGLLAFDPRKRMPLGDALRLLQGLQPKTLKGGNNGGSAGANAIGTCPPAAIGTCVVLV